ITGKVLYLGGPLTFMSQLRAAFDKTLNVQGVCPEHSLYFVAIGAAMYGMEQARKNKPSSVPNSYRFNSAPSTVLKMSMPLTAKSVYGGAPSPTSNIYILDAQKNHGIKHVADTLLSGAAHGYYNETAPLFSSQEELAAFRARHGAAGLRSHNINEYAGPAFLGVDAGSTTVKLAVVAPDGALLYSSYENNDGNPVQRVLDFLSSFYQSFPNVAIARAAATGYGEDLMRAAFGIEDGVVETVAHALAARTLVPSVDFILDIGGQDIKCLSLKNGAVDSIFLNEACSSGCGSFLQTFASALGLPMEDFANAGLLAPHPVDLGSRCTVFMNSSVKQAQKDGATVGDIAAGLAISVVKNALYKVIRPSSREALGKHIVVQGGTFYNDAVLCAFEREMGCEVTRPAQAGLMGAYGAALWARDNLKSQKTLISPDELKVFKHKTTPSVCHRCQNNCRLVVNTFSGGRRFISGNRCERAVTGDAAEKRLNLYEKKLEMLDEICANPGVRPALSPALPKIGLTLGLNMYELLPFWQTFFRALGCETVVSPRSTRALYTAGQGSIPSDTVCYPAKLMHGHAAALDGKCDVIFYPCMSYNIEDGLGDNCYNCPIVAYYPEVIAANMTLQTPFCYGYVGLHRPRSLIPRLYSIVHEFLPKVSQSAVGRAASSGYKALSKWQAAVREQGARIISEARKRCMPILVLAGRPYHADPEVNHGLDLMAASMGAAVVSEDAVFPLNKKEMPPLKVLNQWTYHGRLYGAAAYSATQPDMHFVQLVSFGCGCDAITSDECRRILEERGRLYTQIKIDDIENLGAARIRLRSLLAAVGV
ncbi:MAG: acyl-CoA dehydratase activase-related protein, partial [Clostridia bacterium]|nr:acyl-CoA dehydratase activase-related protein [Clostridia bacterium]